MRANVGEQALVQAFMESASGDFSMPQLVDPETGKAVTEFSNPRVKEALHWPAFFERNHPEGTDLRFLRLSIKTFAQF